MTKLGKSFTNYSFSDWLQYIENLPFGLNNRSLDHVKTVAKKLGLLNFAGKVITVAGTNGKGSSVIFLESILLAAGYQVGAYISPHVLHYNERIRLDGENITDATLCQAFALVEFARDDVALSYFEFTTLAALVTFKKQQPDFLILEVGLGGRFDATNILDSDISIITTVSYDHMQILGDTLNAIGYEKSGVMRPLKPVICGMSMPDSVYVAADNIQAKIYQLGRDFSYIESNGYWGWQFAEVVLENLPQLKLPIASAALALMAINLLSVDFKISLLTITTGLKNAFLLGRWQKLICNKREIIFDVAHNAESAALLALNLTKTSVKGRNLAVVSVLGDKDIVAIFHPLKSVIDNWYCGVLDEARAASSIRLTHAFGQAGITNFVLSGTIAACLQQVIAECRENDRIVVFGSFYTVKEGLVAVNFNR